VKWDARENYINCLNHVLNLALQAFLKKIKALPAKEVDVYDLDEDDDEDDDDVEIDDDEGDDLEEIILNPDLMEEDREYEDIGDDFQGTLKKLRGIAKVCDVARKIPFVPLPN